MLTLCTILFVSQATARAERDDAKNAAEVVRLENKWLDALAGPDVDAIAEVLADD
jgi:ketosteroid isomerase-like protein